MSCCFHVDFADICQHKLRAIIIICNVPLILCHVSKCAWPSPSPKSCGFAEWPGLAPKSCVVSHEYMAWEYVRGIAKPWQDWGCDLRFPTAKRKKMKEVIYVAIEKWGESIQANSEARCGNAYADADSQFCRRCGHKRHWGASQDHCCWVITLKFAS